MNASPNTISSYKCAFRLLLQYLEENTEIKTGHITFEMLNFDLLTDFFDWLVTVRKNSRTTAKQRMGALASFAEYAQCRNLDQLRVPKQFGKDCKEVFPASKGETVQFFYPCGVGNSFLASRFCEKTWLA